MAYYCNHDHYDCKGPYNWYEHFYATAGMIPDLFSNDCDGQLPIFSVIGKGKTGDGLLVRESAQNDDDCFILEFYNDQTLETVYTTPNLHPGKISITQSPKDPVPGQSTALIISISRDGEVTNYSAIIPPGARGSRLYIHKPIMKRSHNGNYTVQTSNLLYNNISPKKDDIPKTGDCVFFCIQEEHATVLALGTIISSNGVDSVVNVRNEFRIPIPYIGDNGNWWVDGVDTGVQAQGPKGDTPYIGENGNWWIAGVDTGVGARGPQGYTPYIGPNGNWWINGQDTGRPSRGEGIEIDGAGDSWEDLPENPSFGDMWVIDGILYFWDGTKWVSLGQIRGPKGDKGDKGDTGENGKSAYELAVENGFEGTLQDFLDRLEAVLDAGYDLDMIINNIYNGEAIPSITTDEIDADWLG